MVDMGDLVAWREIDLYHVKAKEFVFSFMPRFKGGCGGNQISLFFGIHGGGRTPKGRILAKALDTAFYLAKDVGVFLFRNDVDLVFPRNKISLTNTVAV